MKYCCNSCAGPLEVGPFCLAICACRCTQNALPTSCPVTVVVGLLHSGGHLALCNLGMQYSILQYIWNQRLQGFLAGTACPVIAQNNARMQLLHQNWTSKDKNGAATVQLSKDHVLRRIGQLVGKIDLWSSYL